MVDLDVDTTGKRLMYFSHVLYGKSMAFAWKLVSDLFLGFSHLSLSSTATSNVQGCLQETLQAHLAGQAAASRQTPFSAWR